MPRIKAGRSVHVESLCDFSEGEESQKAPTSSESASNITEEIPSGPQKDQTRPQSQLMPAEIREEVTPIEAKEEVSASLVNPVPADEKTREAKDIASSKENGRETNLKNTVATPNFVQENQPIKRQKLEGGNARQILSIKTQILANKSRLGLINGSSSNLCSSTAKICKEDRKVYVREPAVPFVSMAEMMKKFPSNTRDVHTIPHMNGSVSHDAAASIVQRKPRLTLTRPKEPEFEMAQRVRSVRAKSSAELEEEMMAKIPKFKARPVNKKILEAPSLPALPRTTPHLPEFQEFHLETMERANQNAETSTIAATESARQNHQWKPAHLTAPKSPLLQTSLRARPPRIKTSEELEREELEKVPKFKARPLNTKIFESKGELGMFCNTKQHVTIPHEFHFAIDERIPPPVTVADLFDKLSLNSETHHYKHILRNTTPNPFHLHTEIPPKPQPKHCTKPEPFQLESLTRHEEEMQREMEKRRRMEEEEAQMRIFKAQPVLKEDPIPVPEKVRKPLTEVQEFNLHVEHRAVDRSEFDKKIKEKEMMYKRYRDEAESVKLMEEEKALKQLKRTLVPHVRPVPNFDRPFLPQRSSKEITKPKSSKLNVNRRKERRNFVSAVTAASSASSHMR
ncbi:Protein TPX2 [Camellia lanceoleosa]|uniref:Protein TPX2 n=1 Tax=Camellia lanceoleosa TaxID=1840588 RepID=A0ACC0GZZ6_9ERIC|nr:Protein TPX2 [Camellia lanceoleosa]